MNGLPLSLRRRIKPIRDRSSKGDYTKTRAGRDRMDSKFQDQRFTGNRSDNAPGSDSSVFTDFQEMFWEMIHRSFLANPQMLNIIYITHAI